MPDLVNPQLEASVLSGEEPAVLFAPEKEPTESLFSAAYRADSPAHAFTKMMALNNLKVDPNYRLNEEEVKRLREDMHPDMWEPLAEYISKHSYSAVHSDALKGYYLEEIERERRLAEAGMGGLATRMLANLAMPEAIGLAFATGGLGHLTKAGMFQGALRLGVWSAAENAALEAAAAQSSATRGMGDVALSAIAGFTLGGGIAKGSELLVRPASKAYNRAAADEIGEAVHRAGGTQSEARAAAQKAEEALNATQGPDPAVVARAKELEEELQLLDEAQAQADKLLEGDALDEASELLSARRTELEADLGMHRLSMGAARAEEVTPPLQEIADQFNIGEDSTAEAALGGVRAKTNRDVVGLLGSDSNAWVRVQSRRAALEAVGLKDYGVVRHGASEKASILHRTFMAPWRRKSDLGYSKWADEQGLGALDRTSFSKQADYYEAVGDAVRGIDSTAAGVEDGVKATRETFKRFLDRGKKAGVLDEGISDNPNYLPRMAAHDNIRKLTAEHGETKIIKLVAGAMRSNHPELELDASLTHAKWYVRKLRRLGVGMDQGIAHGVRTDDLDYFRSVIREEIPDIDEDHLETILYQTQKATEKASRVARNKRRLDIDETYVDPETGLKVVDLFERNAAKLTYAYSRQMSGWIGLSEQMNIKNPGDMTRFFKELRSRMAEEGRSRDDIEKNVKRFKFLFDGITGLPHETDPGGLYASAARAARDVNLVRVGAAFGLAQLNEIAPMIAGAGLRNVLAHVSELPKLIRMAKDGTMRSEVGRELEAMIAPGTDRLLNTPATRWEEHGFGYTRAGGKVLNALDEGLQRAKRLTMDVGGIAPITIALQRLSSLALAQKFVGFAYGAKVSPAQMARLRGMGLSEEMLERIKAQIKLHSKVDPNSSVKGGRKLRTIGIELWEKTDPEAADHFVLAMNREVRRMIQENDIGQLNPWLTDTTGKLLTQFRSFAIGAWTKHTMHGIHYRDSQAAMNLMLGTFLGTLQYIVQVAANEPDEKRREEKLQFEEIVKAGFQKTGQASLLPMISDTFARTLFRADARDEDDPFRHLLFSHGRSSGLGSGLFQGVATVDLIDKVGRLAGLPAVIARPDDDMTQSDYRALFGTLPVVGGLYGMNRAISALAE